jgi:hypothetical protein
MIICVPNGILGVCDYTRLGILLGAGMWCVGGTSQQLVHIFQVEEASPGPEAVSATELNGANRPQGVTLPMPTWLSSKPAFKFKDRLLDDVRGGNQRAPTAVFAIQDEIARVVVTS